LSLNFTVEHESRAPIKGGASGTPGRIWGYWGRLKVEPYYHLSGSYRATCAWLADKAWKADPHRRDNRMSCTVEISFRSVPTTVVARRNEGSLIAQGLIKVPPGKDTLFSHGSTRRLAIVGGSGSFVGRRGTIDLGGAPQISVSLVA
jgi:hypothetical protein